MNVMFLGTGAGMPAKSRNVTSIALQLLEERKAIWLFDCGEATQHQILHTSIKPRRIEKIFITHMHGDHIYGLPGLLGSRSFQGGETLLTIYGPKGIKEFVEKTLSLSYTHIKYPLEVIEVEDGIAFEDSQFQVVAKKLEHGVPCLGYRIVEKDTLGTLQVDKLVALNVPPGPIYQKLKQGNTVKLEDGRELNGEDFLGPLQEGRIVTILGDTRMCKQSVELALNADLLIHEATFGHADDQLAFDYFHSTTSQAAKIALEADVKQLVITHISSRYQGEDSESLVREAREIFINTDLANDFEKYEVLKQQKRKRLDQPPRG